VATATTREYELVLMLDPEIPDERREQIASEARKRIESDGNLKHDTSWGMRKLAYEIRQRTEADYRLFRFETGGGLLDDLNHNLRIADGVLRFRIFKVDPGLPAIVPPPPLSLSSSQGRGQRRDSRQGGREARGERAERPRSQAAPAAGQAPEPPAESSPEPPAESSPEPPAESSPEPPAESSPEPPPEQAEAGEAGGAPEPEQAS